MQVLSAAGERIAADTAFLDKPAPLEYLVAAEALSYSA